MSKVNYDIDKFIYDKFKEIDQSPTYINDTILNVNLGTIRKEKQSMKDMIKKIVIYIISLALISSGVVFAKDIEKAIKGIFNNSSPAIEEAVNNGYVQNEYSDYCYDNNIGIKVDSLVLDELNLNISFEFKTEDNIKSVRFKDFVITNDNGKTIYQTEIKNYENIEDVPVYKTIKWMNSPVKISDGLFSDSILIGLKDDIEKFNELNIEVKSVNITDKDDNIKQVDGNWNINVKINDDMRKTLKKDFILKETNENVKSGKASLSPTGMVIELVLKEELSLDIFTTEVMESIYIKDGENKLIPEYFNVYNDGSNRVVFSFNNIGLFSNNLDEIEFNLGMYNQVIKLIKK